MTALNYHDQAIRLLASGFAGEFCEYVSNNDRLQELMQDLAFEFVETNIPIIKEVDRLDMASELIMNTRLTH